MTLTLVTPTGQLEWPSNWEILEPMDLNYHQARYMQHTCLEIDLEWHCVNAFVVNPLQIIPNGEEIVPAVLAFAEELNETPLKKWIIY